MQHTPRFAFLRRILFPYSGEEQLTPKQSARVLLAWVLFFPVCMSILTVIITVLSGYPLHTILLMLLFTFLSGVGIFGILGVLVILVNNKSARIRQAWKARDEQL